MEVTLHGVHGVSVAGHVDLDISGALEHVPIPRQNMEDEQSYQQQRLGRATEWRRCNTNVNCPGNKITISIFHGVLSERLESETCT